MTALIMGAGYIAGGYFFVRVARATRWHRVHLGFLPITAFTAFLGVATIIYWDWFDHDHVAFWIWTALYWTTPFLVPVAWLRNRRIDPGTLESADDRYLVRRVRSTLVRPGSGPETLPRRAARSSTPSGCVCRTRLCGRALRLRAAHEHGAAAG